MNRSDRLFRAIVVMGAAITAPACDSGKSRAPAPTVPAPGDATAVAADAQDTPRDALAATDAPADAPTDAATDAPADARRPAAVRRDAAMEPVERVLIL